MRPFFFLWQIWEKNLGLGKMKAILDIHAISLKRASARFSFQGGFSKMYRIYRKILNSDEGDFEILVKSGMF